MSGSPAVIAFVDAVMWFCAFALIHVTGWRWGRQNARWLLTSYGISVIGALLTIDPMMGKYAALDLLLAVLVVLMTGACLFVLYVPAVYVVVTSLSVQTLILLRLNGGRLPEADLYRHFAGRSILEGRLATLAGSGYLASHGSCFRLTARGRALAKIFAFPKALWNLGPGG